MCAAGNDLCCLVCVCLGITACLPVQVGHCISESGSPDSDHEDRVYDLGDSLLE